MYLLTPSYLTSISYRILQYFTSFFFKYLCLDAVSLFGSVAPSCSTSSRRLSSNSLIGVRPSSCRLSLTQCLARQDFTGSFDRGADPSKRDGIYDHECPH